MYLLHVKVVKKKNKNTKLIMKKHVTTFDTLFHIYTYIHLSV